MKSRLGIPKYAPQVLSSILLTVVALGLLANCKSTRGDFTNVFVEEVTVLGGKLARTNGLPAIRATWRMMKDENGFECVVAGTTYAEVTEMVLEAFGVERHEVEDQTDVGPGLLFPALEFGVALLVYETDEGIHMNCLRGFDWRDWKDKMFRENR